MYRKKVRKGYKIFSCLAIYETFEGKGYLKLLKNQNFPSTNFFSFLAIYGKKLRERES